MRSALFKPLEKRDCKGRLPFAGVAGASPASFSLLSRRLRQRTKEEKGVFRGHPEPRAGGSAPAPHFLELLVEKFGMSHEIVSEAPEALRNLEKGT